MLALVHYDYVDCKYNSDVNTNDSDVNVNDSDVEAPVDNVLGTDLEASRVFVVENQRQQYVASLQGFWLWSRKQSW